MTGALWKPKYWAGWLGIGLLHLLVLLPFRTQLWLGKWAGRCMMWLLPWRAQITDINLKLCFPTWSEAKRLALRKRCFENVGMGFFEALTAWLMSARRFNKIPITWIGENNYKAAKAKGGVIAQGAHFTTIELMGRFFGERLPLRLIYKRNKNLLIEHFIQSHRHRYAKPSISHFDVKMMIKQLKAGETLWYSPDQDFGPRHSVFAPFFNVPTPTLRAASALAKVGQASVLPVFFRRLEGKKGYEAVTLPVLEAFPSGDEVADATCYNALLEDYILTCPAQYLWIHRRFKTRPQGWPKVY